MKLYTGNSIRHIKIAHPVALSGEGSMTDQELLISALREAGQILCEYLERGRRDADETITRLIAVLDTQDLALAVKRLEKGYGLRVVK